MLGAIIGDVVGSVYEWNNIKTKDFPLFRKDCFFTDDTVMTCAVAEAIMNGGQKVDFIDAMKKYGRMYPTSLSAEVTHNHPEGVKGAMLQLMLSFCVVFTLVVIVENTSNQLRTILQSVKDGLRII